MLAAGCMTRTTRYFTPVEDEPHLRQNAVRDESDALLRVECERLMGTSDGALGSAKFTVDVAQNGEVTRAQLRSSSGDERMDTIFGGLVARLAFDPLPSGSDGTTARVDIGYSCSPTAAATTLLVNTPPSPPRR